MTYFMYQSKRIFYKEIGVGKPLIMLHGDPASSVMFEFLLPLYQENFRVVLIDFLGFNPLSNTAAKSSTDDLAAVFTKMQKTESGASQKRSTIYN